MAASQAIVFFRLRLSTNWSARTSSVARLRLRLTEGKNFVNSFNFIIYEKVIYISVVRSLMYFVYFRTGEA